MKNIYKTLFKTLNLLFIVILFTACSSWSNFKLNKDQKPPVIPDTIAVISGSTSDFDIHFTEKVSEELMKTQFKVLTQDQIKKIFPQYPEDILNFKISEKEFTKPYISEETKKIIDSMNSKLKVKYILLAWTDPTVIDMVGRMGNVQSKTVEVCFYTRLIQYPELTIVGYTYVCHAKGLGFLFFIDTDKKIAKAIESIINKKSQDIVNEINKLTMVSDKDSK